jgi:hypothetical protein
VRLTRACSCRGPKRCGRRRLCLIELVGGGLRRPPQLKRMSLGHIRGTPVITIHEMLPLLVAASPGFEPAWRDFQDEWKGDEPLPRYLVLADYVRHMSALMVAGDESTLRRIFAAIERLHVEGDHAVREAATVGILEDLQNTNLHNGTTPQQFEALLLPESARFWKKVKDFWERGEIITDD